MGEIKIFLILQFTNQNILKWERFIFDDECALPFCRDCLSNVEYLLLVEKMEGTKFRIRYHHEVSHENKYYLLQSEWSCFN